MDNYVLASLSNEQLMELPYLVASEQITRGLVKSAKLNAGKYTVGKDFPAGAYKIRLTSKYSMNVVVHDKKGECTINTASLGNWRRDG